MNEKLINFKNQVEEKKKKQKKNPQLTRMCIGGEVRHANTCFKYILINAFCNTKKSV